MILVPFSFNRTFSSGGVPSNKVAPFIEIFDAETRAISYTPGTWAKANSIEFAWYMNDVLQNETSDTFVALFRRDIKVIETAVNEFGEITETSNVVNIPPPPYYDEAGLSWALEGDVLDSSGSFEDNAGLSWTLEGDVLDSAGSFEDNAGLSWTLEGDVLDSAGSFEDTAGVNWEVFGSYV